VDEKTMNRSVHFIGICGKGMGAIAGALAREGWKVTGCDENPRPPMSRHLEEAGIHITSPCRAEDLPEDDAEIIVGKRMPSDHPILTTLLARKKAWLSFPAFLSRHFLSNSRNAVVAGGVGKTTTTSLLSHILRHAGHDPDYLIGAQPRGFPAPAKLAGAGTFVIEGDEYASCGDDPRPKFLHYHPEVAVVTNLLEDHPDLYANKEALSNAFRALVALLPPRGLLVLPDDDADALALARHAASPFKRVGFGENADPRIVVREMTPEASGFLLGETVVDLPMSGRMNVRNAAMAMVAAGHFGVGASTAAAALSSFKGIEKRQESRTIGAVQMITDKATHPAAIAGLFEAVRQRFPGRRLVSILQPRATGGKGWIYQSHLPGTLSAADLVVLFPAYEHQPQPGREWNGGAFDMEELARATRSTGTKVEQAAGIGDTTTLLPRILESGDVIVLSLPEQAAALESAVTETLEMLAARPGC
jgi:UDP-N-acetylmuramate: L-alanyl-gamma-D-glutamyl-meso-diaminopimelate ligase